MKMFRTAALVLPMNLALVATAWADEQLTTDIDDKKLSYAIGMLIGNQMGQQLKGFEFDTTELSAGFTAGQAGDEATMSIHDAQHMFQAAAAQVQQMAAQLALDEGNAFLEENAKVDGVTTTDSGLQYKVVAEGEGDSPTPTDTVSVHYTGKLLDGTVFDSSVQRGQPAQFPVNGVIKGWIEALQLMKPGGKLEVWIPAEMAYGLRGSPPAIGPNEVLNFEKELLSIVGQ